MHPTRHRRSTTLIRWMCDRSWMSMSLVFLTCNISHGVDTPNDFFEAKIRPVLIEHCHGCHGSKKQSGGLRLDQRDSFAQGGDTGPIVVAGKPDDSLLIQALRHSGEYAMPPKGKLPEPTIRHFEEWVRQGAHWPPGGQQLANGDAMAQAEKIKSHWAFQPVRKPQVPESKKQKHSEEEANRNEVQEADNGVTQAAKSIDAFVFQKLADCNLDLSPQADRRTLIRRVTYSLTGLPPSWEEVEDFVQDETPDAYQQLVERLLDSVHYGEHWGRHWLDVSRYSDTKGYVYGREERFWTHAWAYRDWVVKSLNADMPYDRFLLLQLAADQVEDSEHEDLAAMGFLTLGRRFLGVRREIIDDRIDVVSRGMMGLTVSCARCHDHKFDPIPAADYYSLYGVFDSCMEQLVPLSDRSKQRGISAGDADADGNFDSELQKRQAKLAGQMAARRDESESRIRERAADYLFAQSELEKYPANGFDQIFDSKDLLPAVVRRWSSFLHQTTKRDDPVFLPWKKYAGIPADNFAEVASQITQQINAQHASLLNPRIAEQFKTAPTSLREVCNRYGDIFADVASRWHTMVKEAEARQMPVPGEMPDPHLEAIRKVLYGVESPCKIPPGSIIDCETFFDSAVCTELWKLQGEVDRWIIQSPQHQAFALTLQDLPVPRDPRIFKRGDPLRLGREIPRQFLSVLSGQERQPFQKGSGRLELAKAIIDPANPLTARVIVNRVWMHHFGSGLVSTPSDFGTRAAPPSHPDLLDWLTTEFINNKWSLKNLHRQMLLSKTFQQSSSGPAPYDRLQEHLNVDPDNRLLWRFNPKRLQFEELRDSILVANGQIDLRTGGKPDRLFKAPYPTRRTLYGLVDRQYLPGTLRIFDFASPDLHVPKRSETTVPQQALFFMNHPWMLQQAKILAEHSSQPEAKNELADWQRVTRLFQMILQRNPSSEESKDALRLVNEPADNSTATPRETRKNWTYGYGPFDDTENKAESFTELPHFTGKAWQGGENFPDSRLGWAQLTATGGHPGNDRQHAVIRRWTADRDTTVKIRSTLTHEPEMGDGIRAFITSTTAGLLHGIELHHASRKLDVETLDVKRGDVMDFIVDIGNGLNNDQYLWTVVIEEIGTTGNETIWNSGADFPTPESNTMDGWEQLAQVLMCSNEFLFID